MKKKDSSKTIYFIFKYKNNLEILKIFLSSHK
jgi:hypothetical protein